MGKPNVAFFENLVAVSGHERHEIAYVGDRLDNDIAPAAEAGLVTVWARRGPWGYILRPNELMGCGIATHGRSVPDSRDVERPGHRLERRADRRHEQA